MQKVLAAVAEAILRTDPLPAFPGGVRHIVAVSGAAGLGKTTFSCALAVCLKALGLESCHLELDGYIKNRAERRTEGISGYDPRATRFPALLDDLDAIIARGEPRDIPYYDHAIGCVNASVRREPVPTLSTARAAKSSSAPRAFPRAAAPIERAK